MKLLIFGGTTEGRELAEWCAEKLISADVSVTTDYGARLLGSGGYLNVFTGKLDRAEMKTLISAGSYDAVIDATHPYAVEATANILTACKETGTRYYRLLRAKSEISGTSAGSMDELIGLLDKTGGTILSTLGAKELPELARMRDRKRIWLRVLPADGIEEQCVSYGFDRAHVIIGKGPFSTEENIAHIRQSGADILVTKESGKAGGYPEKAEAAQKCGIGMITLTRPEEDGYSFDKLTEILTEKL